MTQSHRQYRYPATFPLILKSRATPQTVNAVDINPGGARLEGVKGLNPGDRVTLEALNERVTGTVRWIMNDRAGVSFTLPAPARFVDIVRQAAGPTAGRNSQSHGFREMR